MQTKFELANANGRVIELPVSVRRARPKAAEERRARPISLLMIVKEVKRSERVETMVWAGIAIAATLLLVLSFA
jgi:hypothetical protein